MLAESSLGRVVVADGTGTVRFLRRDEGRVVERVDLDGEVTAGPTASNEAPQLAFVATRDGRVHAIDRMEGTVRWVHEAFGGVEHAPATGHPSLGRDALVVVPTTAGLEVVDDDGRGRWRADLPWPAADRPTMAGDRVFVGATDGTLHAFDLHTGAPLWETRVLADVPQSGFECPIAATPNALYVVSDDRLHAFDPASGERRWQYVPDDREERDGLRPAADLSDALLVPRRGGLTALKPGGGVGLGAFRVDPARWHADLGTSVRTGTVAGRRFYALVAGGEEEGGDRLVAFE